MTFFDNHPQHLPYDGEYYYNILVVCIGMQPYIAKEVFPQQEVKDIWDIDNITAARPYAVHIYEDSGLDRDIDFEIQCFPHTVLEVSQKYGLSFYDMIDFDTENPWEIE